MIVVTMVKGQEMTIEMVSVVCEYLDVFPEELSGLQPMREDKFDIDVVPGTALISKPAYRMSPIEMSELKIQIEEL